MEDTKKYSIVGKVEIGTDEYRDLIEDVAQYKKELYASRSNYWRKSSECSDLKTENTTLKETLKRHNEFFEENPSIKQEFLIWVSSKLEDKKFTED